MKETAAAVQKNIVLALSVLSVVLLCGLVFGGYEYYQLRNAFLALESKYTEATTTLEQTAAEKASLASSLADEQQKNTSFADQISGITNTVTKIDKLQQTDPQLLAKYSKVYFLSENYIPKELTLLASSSTYADTKTYELIPQAATRIEAMIAAAKADGVNLLVISSYRSFQNQESLKSSYKTTFGSGANKFSADQGYSEHQLGTAVDFTTKELGANFASFDKATAYKWLLDNGYRFGFILSYPAGNGYYVFEPWHWRYVGISLALDLHDMKKSFYELDQRTINNYLLDFANER